MQQYVIGIDEAGRGPVLGPMVYGASVCLLEEAKNLKRYGFDDSKVLSAKQRKTMFDTIKQADGLWWKVKVISAREISSKMLARSRTSLNEISHLAAIELIQNFIDEGFPIAEAYIDTVGDPRSYALRLERLFPKTRIVVAKKADSIYPIVSAASICAKETRDRSLEDWDFEEEGLKKDVNFGSGYPGDEVTKKWMVHNFDKVFGFPSLVRFSWSTAFKYTNINGVSIDWGDEEDQSKQNTMDAFISKKRRKGSIRQIQWTDRSPFFKNRKMDLITEL